MNKVNTCFFCNKVKPITEDWTLKGDGDFWEYETQNYEKCCEDCEKTWEDDNEKR